MTMQQGVRPGMPMDQDNQMVCSMFPGPPVAQWV